MRKKRNIKVIIVAVLVIILLAGLYYGYKYHKIAMIAAGYESKMMCSEIFVAGRESKNILETELSNPLLEYFSWAADYDKKLVESSFMGLFGQQTSYFKGFGGIRGIEPSNNFFEEAPESIKVSMIPKDMPSYKTFPQKFDSLELDRIIKEAFSERDSLRLKNTRAVIIIYNDTLLVEKYSRGYDRNTRLLGWSMTKSVISAWIGILAGEGKLDIRDPVPVKEWQGENDKRKFITWDDLLRMRSGLEFSEEYDNLTSDVLTMLFYEENICDFPVSKRLEKTPGEFWKYSSGTTNILTIALKSYYDSFTEYWEFPYKQIFEKADIRTAIIEPDVKGYFVGSSFMYAAPLDWARFGLLYLHKGEINGNRIFPASWVEYTTRRTENSEDQKYGAHFWLPPLNDQGNTGNLPEDYFYAAGHNGQYISILPSSNMVIVRMGYTEEPASWNQDMFIYEILQTLQK